MKTLSQIYLFSDIDGTLGIAGQGIPRRNIDAIQRFVDKGGNFALSTGRWITDIKHFVKEIPINSLSIINNGGAIYDFDRDCCIKNQSLPEQAADYMWEILRLYPEIGVLAVNMSGYYFIDTRNGRHPGFDDDPRRFPVCRFKDINGPYLKFLFSFNDNDFEVEKMIRQLKDCAYEGVGFVQSSSRCVEMVPAGVSKGSAFLELCQQQKIPIENTVFIGDSYNDREILQEAGFSACVDTTPEDLRMLCDLVLGSCMDGAVADLIEYLEEKYA